MKKSALPPEAGVLYSLMAGGILLLIFSFKTITDDEQLLSWSNNCLLHLFDPGAAGNLKKWDLSVTGDGFLRFKKYYPKGKQEYYSFHLRRLKDVDYLGTTTTGMLRITTQEDDIIVQTYNDPKGNIDSMATSVSLPLRGAEPEQLDSLRQALFQLKEKH